MKNMTFEIDRTRDKIEKLDAKMIQICEKRRKLEQQENKLTRDRILNEELLNGRKWELQTWGDDGHFCLTVREDEFPGLVEVLDPQKNGHHFGLQLDDNVRISYNDGELSIGFEDYSSGLVMDFIHKCGISVNMKSITKLLNEIQERFETIKMIYDQFKGLEEH